MVGGRRPLRSHRKIRARNYLNTGYAVPGWRSAVNFSKTARSCSFQFDYDHFGIPGGVLANQEALYTNVSGDTTGAFTGLGGSTHIWSFTLNPTFNFYQSDSWGAYAVAGGGFYHKVTNFTVPSVGTYCDYFGYCYQYQTTRSSTTTPARPWRHRRSRPYVQVLPLVQRASLRRSPLRPHLQPGSLG